MKNAILVSCFLCFVLVSPAAAMKDGDTIATFKVSMKDTPAVKAYDRGMELFQEGKWDEAVQAFTQALAGEFNVANAYFYRGTAYHNQGNMDAAIADYSEVMRLSPENATAVGNRGESYRLLGKLDLALADLNAAHQLDPQDIRILANRGVARYSLGDVEGAIADFSAAIAIDDNNSYLWGTRASLLAVAERTEEALRDVRKAKSLGWTDPDQLEAQLLENLPE